MVLNVFCVVRLVRILFLDRLFRLCSFMVMFSGLFKYEFSLYLFIFSVVVSSGVMVVRVIKFILSFWSID